LGGFIILISFLSRSIAHPQFQFEYLKYKIGLNSKLGEKDFGDLCQNAPSGAFQEISEVIFFVNKKCEKENGQKRSANLK